MLCKSYPTEDPYLPYCIPPFLPKAASSSLHLQASQAPAGSSSQVPAAVAAVTSADSMAALSPPAHPSSLSDSRTDYGASTNERRSIASTPTRILLSPHRWPQAAPDHCQGLDGLPLLSIGPGVMPLCQLPDSSSGGAVTTAFLEEQLLNRWVAAWGEGGEGRVVCCWGGEGGVLCGGERKIARFKLIILLSLNCVR